MFPTFISILDIQSWWEVPSIAHFCSLFRTAFNLLDFDIEDLEEALLTDGTEESSWLQELIVRLLSGCLPNNEISTFNYQMFLRRLFRQKCQEHDQYNPFNTDVDFQLLPLRTKVDILHTLCDFRLDADDVLDQLKNLEADSLRVEPLGYDSNDSAYWYFYGTRLYREDFKTKNNKKKSVWQVICFTEDDWYQLNKKFKKSTVKCERQLYRTLSENFLPELPRLFREKERLARKRLLENQPRRTSRRLRKDNPEEREEEGCDIPKKNTLEEEKQKKQATEITRRESYERRNKRKEQSEDSESDQSESRYEMGGAKARQKKSKGRQRKLSTSSTNSKDASSKTSKRKKTNEDTSKSSTSSTTTTVGRQTNNSLAAATGQIVIQPVANLHKKKLKTSQVFRQTDEDLITGMHKILDYVKNHEDAWPFADPVDEEYAPNYYSVIRKPMDLQRMEERLDAGYYKNFTKFREDFQLIVDNCRLYNGAENEYTEMVDNLSKVFDRACEKFLDQISSSDDEIAVEFPNSEKNVKDAKKIAKPENKKSSKRKPTLAAKTDRKREHSVSEESLDKRSLSYDSLVDTNDDEKEKITPTKKDKNNKKLNKISKKEKSESKKNKDKKNTKTNSKHKKEKYSSPTRSRSPSRSVSRNSFFRSYSSSPPPSSAPSSPDNRFDFFPKKHNQKSHEIKDTENNSHVKAKQKHKQDKYKELFDQDNTSSCDTEIKKQSEKPLALPSKPKDKHNKLRETIEKLKAKSEISNKLNDQEFCFDLDTPKENKEKPKKDKDDKNKNKKDKLINKAHSKKEFDYEDSNSTMESIHISDNKKSKKNSKNSNKNDKIDALTIATEQTLKDINKWLDDTPKFYECSSASNSPSYPPLDDFDIVNRTDNESRKKLEKFASKKDGIVKDIKRRTFSRDPAKFLKRREVQRTIDRLQPGKSKGNLISNVQSSKQTDELFPLGPLSKTKDSKNSLIVKTDDNAPKLSLGSVLDSFGRHKFVDDNLKSEETEDKKDAFSFQTAANSDVKEETDVKLKQENEKKESLIAEESSMMSGATPNLSAWFKAFGAPKVSSAQKKNDTKAEGKDSEKLDDLKSKEEISSKVSVPELSPNTDSPVTAHGQPIPRQRKVSTGSSVSERSSFSQDMDSPRVGIDERLGAYPAPYPSPLHRSPSGASPVMASPRPDVSPKAAPYPPFNGQIRVGFYQDTVSNKSSPDKSCSPRDNPQSPYTQCSEHVYTPNTTQNLAYSYPNSPYYSHTPNYSNPNPTPPYNPENVNPNPYYDTNKSLTDQYQAKATQNYNAASPANNIPSPSHPQPSPAESFRQEDQTSSKVNDKMAQSAMFPVKKRAYNESEQVRFETEVIRNLENHNSHSVSENTHIQNARNEESLKHSYIHQNIPEPKPLTVQTNVDAYNKLPNSGPPIQQQQMPSPVINYSSPSNPYNNTYGNESNYPLNIPTRSLASTPGIDRKIDISKYTNMGYSGAEVNFSRTMSQYNRPEMTYARPPSGDVQPSNQQNQPPAEASSHYSSSNPHMGYKAMDPTTSNPQQAHSNYTNTSAHSNINRLAQPLDVQSSYKANDVSIPRPTYNTHIDMDQPLGLRGNIANHISHIVDRYNNDDRMLSGLQSSAGQYYGDKGLGGPPMFNKPICTSSSGLPIFNQPNMGIQSYNQNMQVPTSSIYNRQMTELQSPIVSNEVKNSSATQQSVEKKSKKRKTNKNAQAAPSADSPAPATSQGFQSYAGLKSNSPMEPSAISLKTASVVPGSAFNFGPSPSALGLSSGLYGDKDAYPNFLDDFRAAPNYYIAAASAAHHRSTPEAPDKQTRVAAHQSSSRQAPTYPFIGARQATPPSYPLGSHFMPSAQAPLMDASSPLYQHYLQAGVLNQGLLGPPGAYPPGYHPALSMRQPYDSMTRPPWL